MHGNKQTNKQNKYVKMQIQIQKIHRHIHLQFSLHSLKSQNKTKQMILLKFAQCVKQQPHTGNPLHRPGGNMNHWPFCKTWPSVPHSSTTERGSGKADCRGGLNEGLKKTQISFQMPGQHEGKRPDKCGDSGTETAKGYPRILSARVVAGVERWRDLERVKSRGLP